MKFSFNNAFLVDILRHTTIEPSFFLINVSIVATNFLFTNLYIQKKCRINGTIEEFDVSTPCDDEKAGQVFLTQINSWRYSLGMTLMIIFTVLGSSWSEKAGRRRKPLIFIPLVGQVMVSTIGLAFSYFWHWPVMAAVWLETITHGVTGGRFSLIYSIQICISDLTTQENRTVRLGIMGLVHILSIPVGNAMSGVAMRRLGLSWSFSICIALSVLSIALAIALMKDTSIPVEKKVPFWQAINPTGVYESLKVITKKRAANRRLLIWLLLLADALCFFPTLGEAVIFYLYVRYRFGWNEEDYGIYTSYKLMVIAAGLVFSTLVLSKYLKIHDAIIGMMATVTGCLVANFYAMAYQGWHLYAISSLEFFRGAELIAISSFLTKCLDSNEIGHLMSIRCLLSFVTPLCFPVYNFVYYLTMDSFPSAFFIVNIAFYIQITLLLGITFYLHTQTNVKEITPHPS